MIENQPVKLRPGRPSDRKLVIPHAAQLQPEQVLWLLLANGFIMEEHQGRPKLRDHSERIHHNDCDVWEQWDGKPSMVVLS